MIVRRREFKRKRSYKRREARRHPLPRLLRDLYTNFRTELYAALACSSPMFQCLEEAKATHGIQWGGMGMYWDVTIGRELHR